MRKILVTGCYFPSLPPMEWVGYLHDEAQICYFKWIHSVSRKELDTIVLLAAGYPNTLGTWSKVNTINSNQLFDFRIGSANRAWCQSDITFFDANEGNFYCRFYFLFTTEEIPESEPGSESESESETNDSKIQIRFENPPSNWAYLYNLSKPPFSFLRLCSVYSLEFIYSIFEAI